MVRRLIKKRFYQYALSCCLIGSMCAGGVIDTLQSCLQTLPALAVGAATTTHKGLTWLGRGSALEGAANIAAAWVAFNLVNLAYHSISSTSELQVIRKQVAESDAEKIITGQVKDALKQRNKQLFLQQVASILKKQPTTSLLEQQITKLEDCKKRLEPYLTIGSMIGMSQEIRVPLMHVYGNRFLATLHSIYLKTCSHKSLNAGFTLQAEINGLTFNDLENMEKNVQYYLDNTKLMWPYMLLKPTYKYAAMLYWNCMAKIAYLNKMKTLL